MSRQVKALLLTSGRKGVEIGAEMGLQLKALPYKTLCIIEVPEEHAYINIKSIEYSCIPIS